MSQNLTPLSEATDQDWASVLFDLAAQQRHLSPYYQRSQQQALNKGSLLGPLAKCCQILANQRSCGIAIERSLTRLAHKPVSREAAEVIARALMNQQDPDAWRAVGHISPLPAKLLRALLTWPDRPGLLEKVINALESQPRLAMQLREQATAYTAQSKPLALKAALLLLGPYRSREVLLLSHFETSLMQPYFPLRDSLLQRRALMNEVLLRLQQYLQCEFPCRIELLTYLLLYDCWRHAQWTTRLRWQPDPRYPITDINHWLKADKPVDQHWAERLVRYWQLGPEVEPFLYSATPPRSPQQASVQLAIASVHFPPTHDQQLASALSTCGLSMQNYTTLVQHSMEFIGYYSPWPLRRY